MKIEQVMKYCEEYPGVTSDFPFGSQPKCYRVGRRIFAEVYPEGVPGAMRILFDDEKIPRSRVVPMVTLRCNREQGLMLQDTFPKNICRPYHCPPAQQPYSRTVFIDDSISERIVAEMIHEAYYVVLGKLTKKEREAICNKQGD